MVWLKLIGLWQGFQRKRLIMIFFYGRGKRSVLRRPFDSSTHHTWC